MLNLIKMNMYRLLKSKNFIALIVMIVLAFAITKVQVLLVTGAATIETATVDEDGNITYETVDTGVAEEAPDFTVMDLFAGFSSEMTALFMAIFAVVYCENERKNGFVKNLSVNKREKPLVFAAKVAPVTVFAILLQISVFIGVAIAALTYKDIKFGEVMPVLKYTGIETVLTIAFGMFSMAMYELFRKNVPAIIIGSFTAIGLTSQIVSLIQVGLNKLGILSDSFCEKFIFADHLISTRIAVINPLDLAGGKVPALVIGAVGLVFYLAVGMTLYGKKDVV
jgi:hypothetical protein